MNWEMPLLPSYGKVNNDMPGVPPWMSRILLKVEEVSVKRCLAATEVQFF